MTKRGYQVEDRRTIALKIIGELGCSQREIAELIRTRAENKCSVRTLQSWLSDPKLASARPFPQWALTALRMIQVEKGNKR